MPQMPHMAEIVCSEWKATPFHAIMAIQQAVKAVVLPRGSRQHEKTPLDMETIG